MLFDCHYEKQTITPLRLGFMIYKFILAYYSSSFLIELICAHARLLCTLQVSLRLVSRSGGVDFPPL